MDEMETNKYLWQPRRNGPIHLRVSYRDLTGEKREFRRSLRTNHWPTARKIRDAEFMSIIQDMAKARTQLELIHALYPQLEEQLERGAHGGYAHDPSAPVPVTLPMSTDQVSHTCRMARPPAGNERLGARPGTSSARGCADCLRDSESRPMAGADLPKPPKPDPLLPPPVRPILSPWSEGDFLSVCICLTWGNVDPAASRIVMV